MGRCAYCNKFIIGGKKQGKLRFCGNDCFQYGYLFALAEEAEPGLVEEQVLAVREMDCPICGGVGPVDFSTSHRAWSVIILTSWNDSPLLSCASCGKKAIWNGIAFTSLCGWWGIPFGLLVTPWQIMNGFKSLGKIPHDGEPSEELNKRVKLQIAAEIMQNQQT